MLGIGLMADSFPGFSEPPVPRWVSPKESHFLADEGKVLLEWELPDNPPATAPFEFQLEQSVQPDFAESALRYEGADRATFVTGLAKGNYYYRVRAVTGSEGSGSWSKVVEVNVEFVSTTLVVTLFSVGMVVFVMTVVSILKGHRACLKQPESQPPQDEGGQT